jgi:hypothetical protein
LPSLCFFFPVSSHLQRISPSPWDPRGTINPTQGLSLSTDAYGCLMMVLCELLEDAQECRGMNIQKKAAPDWISTHTRGSRRAIHRASGHPDQPVPHVCLGPSQPKAQLLRVQGGRGAQSSPCLCDRG